MKLRLRKFCKLAVFSTLLLAQSLYAADKPWTEVKSVHYRVLTDGADRDALNVAREFERMRAVFLMQFPDFRLETGTPLVILVPRDAASMKQLVPWLWDNQLSPTAYFHHGWNKQYAVVRADPMQSDLRNPDLYVFVYHEFIYSALRSNFRSLPVWLEEGFAQYYGYTSFQNGVMTIGAPPQNRGLFSLLESRPLIPLDVFCNIDRRSSYFREDRKTHQFYAQAWALTHFLFHGPEMGNGLKMKQFVDALNQNEDEKNAFEKTFGTYDQVTRNLELYLRNYGYPNMRGPIPQVEDKDLQKRALTLAETQAEMASFALTAGQMDQARPFVESAMKLDPALGLAREAQAFLNLSEGKAADAASGFAKAVELDQTLYLSLYAKTMLANAGKADDPASQISLHDDLLKVLDLNKEYAPAYLELSKMYFRQGSLTKALGMARKAEQLEPSRAGYRVLSGQILFDLKRTAEAAVLAKSVAERRPGLDRDAAIELWERIPAGQRAPIPDSYRNDGKDVQIVQGTVKSVTCGERDPQEADLVIGDSDSPVWLRGGALIFLSDGKDLTFDGKKWAADFSDAFWYGKDNSNFCHHAEGQRALISYKQSSDKKYAGELVNVELLEDLPSPATVPRTDVSQGKAVN